MKRLLFACLLVVLTLPLLAQTAQPSSPSPQPAPQPVPFGCFGPGDTDNRPNYCPETGTYSTCVKSSGGCTWTSCDGEHTSTSTDPQCCCMRSQTCPKATYWGICIG